MDGKTHVIYSVLAMRHNRLYNLTARGLAVTGNESLFDKFINSFRFLPYLKTTFEKQTGGDNLFSVMAPSPINILQNRSTGATKRTDYYAFDSSMAMSYGITALGLDKYYWADGNSTLLNDYARFHFNDSLAINNVFGTDSLIYKKNVANGNTEGRELLLKTMANDSYTRVRIMQYADSVFVINMKGDKELVTNSDADMFFNSFRFSKENFSTTAFTSKTDLLITDLQSGERTQNKAATEALKKGTRFPAQDLSKICNALLYDHYAAESNGPELTRLLAQTIVPYAGEELFNFIRSNYPALKGKREDVRLAMINILSASNSTQAYGLLKSLLLTDPPAGADYGEAFANFRRFPSAASGLFPEIVQKLKDESMAPFVLAAAAMLIDSNKIQYNSLKEYDDDIFRLGKKVLKKYQENNNEKYELPFTSALLEMLARANQKQSKSILNDLIDLQNYNLSLMIMKAQAKGGQPVSAGLLDWFCKTPLRRIELYDELSKMGKQSFFKGEYASQHSFADAFARIYSDSEIGESVPKYYEIAVIKDATVNQLISRFYIIKVTCQFRRSTESFTCIVGPFSTNPSEFSIKEGKELYILYRTAYDPKSIDKIFTDFIDKISKIK
jgi:hypothetical protein